MQTLVEIQNIPVDRICLTVGVFQVGWIASKTETQRNLAIRHPSPHSTEI